MSLRMCSGPTCGKYFSSLRNGLCCGCKYGITTEEPMWRSDEHMSLCIGSNCRKYFFTKDLKARNGLCRRCEHNQIVNIPSHQSDEDRDGVYYDTLMELRSQFGANNI